jgi:hypothetical protein
VCGAHGARACAVHSLAVHNHRTLARWRQGVSGSVSIPTLSQQNFLRASFNSKTPQFRSETRKAIRIPESPPLFYSSCHPSRMPNCRAGDKPKSLGNAQLSRAFRPQNSPTRFREDPLVFVFAPGRTTRIKYGCTVDWGVWARAARWGDYVGANPPINRTTVLLGLARFGLKVAKLAMQVMPPCRLKPLDLVSAASRFRPIAAREFCGCQQQFPIVPLARPLIYIAIASLEI